MFYSLARVDVVRISTSDMFDQTAATYALVERGTAEGSFAKIILFDNLDLLLSLSIEEEVTTLALK